MTMSDTDRRLAEMGIDRYVLRGPCRPDAAVPADLAAAEPAASGPLPATPRPAIAAVPHDPTAAASRAAVLLIADTTGPAALIEDIGRGLERLRVNWSRAGADDDALTSAAGFVVLGEPLARRVAASLPTERLGACEWVIADPAADLARAAAAKRALWGELKRLARSLAARHGES